MPDRTLAMSERGSGPTKGPPSDATGGWHRGCEVAGLWGVAVAQPVLGLLGDAPEFFVANDVATGELFTFALLVAVAPALVLAGLDLLAWRIGSRVGAVVHSVLVGALGATLALSVLRQTNVSADLVVWLLAAAVGIIIVLAERSVRTFAAILRWLAVTPIVFAALFLFGSPANRLLVSDEVAAEDGVAVERPAPIVVLQLDELPLSSLLKPDGSINETRFPNFARLAAASTWYPNAYALASETTLSVPSTLTGLAPDRDLLATSSDHPRNLFTLLGLGYEQRVSETLTQLCPTTVCTDDVGPRSTDGGLVAALADTSVVLAHQLLPPGARQRLPSVEDAWAGFADGEPSRDDADDGLDSHRPGDALDPKAEQVAAVRDGFDSAIDDLAGMDDRTLWFTHVLLPHSPWLLDQYGTTYPPAGPNPRGRPDDKRWTRELDVLQGFQRHTLQLAHLDAQLGRIIDGLESQGVWDGAFVAVLADHGVSFQVGTQYRSPIPDTVNEIFNVPFFVKLPGQAAGATNESYVSPTDVLPTIVDALGIDTDWSFDGNSLVDGESGHSNVIYPLGITEGATGIEVSPEQTLVAAARNHGWLHVDDGVRGVFAVGPYGTFQGEPLERVPVEGEVPWGWEMAPDPRVLGRGTGDPDPEPLVIDGTFAPQAGASVGQGALITVNGFVAGTVEVYESTPSGSRFTGVLSPDYFSDDGSNAVQVLIADEPVFRLALPALP